jgi:hypothetical protein
MVERTVEKPLIIYTCVSEDTIDDVPGVAVIRWSTDPTALDSLPTPHGDQKHPVSKSRVAFAYCDEPRDDLCWLMSCRGRLGANEWGSKSICRYTFDMVEEEDNGALGVLWLCEE